MPKAAKRRPQTERLEAEKSALEQRKSEMLKKLEGTAGAPLYVTSLPDCWVWVGPGFFGDDKAKKTPPR